MASAKEIVLIVDDEKEVAEYHSSLLAQLGFVGLIETDPHNVIGILSRDPAIRLVLLDMRMPTMSGLELLAQLRVRFPAVGVIIATVVNDIELAVEAIKSGAYNYLLKPVQLERLDRVINSYRAHRPHTFRNDSRFSSFVTADPVFESIFQKLLSFATQDVPILITGETGTGKEIIAGLVHSLSSRTSKPYVPVNVSAISGTLFESEVFGHVRGAFTGASGDKKGFLDSAQGGTLFLDEIGELSLEHQAKFLRVLQNGQYQRVGSASVIQSTSRFVFATNRDLRAEIEKNTFREDLFYRVSSHAIHIPPLRERKGDIQVLAHYFLRKYCSQYGRFVEGITPESIEYLTAYPFPGNVRELEGIMSSAVLLEDGLYLQPSSLPSIITQSRTRTGPVQVYSGDLKGLRIQAILKTLDECNGNQTTAASKLGIARGSLNRILKKFYEENEDGLG